MTTQLYMRSIIGPLKKIVYQASLILVVTIALPFIDDLRAETRQHASHQHGHAELNVVFEDGQVFMELSSPAANIVGFEHFPENAQQEKTVHDAGEVLKKGDELFHFTAKAQCTLNGSHVESVLLEEHHDEEHSAKSTHEDEHGGHNDIDATYVFTCSKPNELQAIDVMLFDYFSGFEEIEVQLLAQGNQKAAELTPKQNRISLKW